MIECCTVRIPALIDWIDGIEDDDDDDDGGGTNTSLE